MENEDEVQSNGTKTLLIRHLPAELSQEEKEDFLKYFGAKSVKVFPNWGRLVGDVILNIVNYLWAYIQCEKTCPSPQKHAAFASFTSERMAAKVSVLCSVPRVHLVSCQFAPRDGVHSSPRLL